MEWSDPGWCHGPWGVPGQRKGCHHLFPEVEEVVGLVNEEELERGAAQVVAAQVDLAQVGQGALEVVTDPCRDEETHNIVGVTIPPEPKS